MPSQAPGISYSVVAREWRCKWSDEDGRKSATLVQQTWERFRAEVKNIPGVVQVQRFCCGTCLDYKIVVSMREDAYDEWAARKHHPEGLVLEELSGIEGVSSVEAQLYSVQDQ